MKQIQNPAVRNASRAHSYSLDIIVNLKVLVRYFAKYLINNGGTSYLNSFNTEPKISKSQKKYR